MMIVWTWKRTRKKRHNERENCKLDIIEQVSQRFLLDKQLMAWPCVKVLKVSFLQYW